MTQQLSLFSSPSCSAPADAHETILLDAAGNRTTDHALAVTLRVRLRVTGDSIDQPIPTGPLTYAECQSWELPCKLYHCRYRLDDAVEIRTRFVSEPDENEDGIPLSEFRGPRTQRGAYYSNAEMHPGDWCALAVAERGGLALEELGTMFNMTREGVNKTMVLPALDAADQTDRDLDDAFDSFATDGHREPPRIAPPPDDNVTSTEAKNLLVPGEVKKGRWVPTIRRRKRSGWNGVTHIVVPEHFADRVDERLMKPLAPSNDIPSRFSDMSEMLKARGKKAA